MAENINLKELEKKAYRSTFQDGFWDIFLALILLAMAANAFLSSRGLSELQAMSVFICLEGFAIGVLIVGKRRITVPRMGQVKFGPKRKAKLNKVRIVLFLSVIIGLVAFVAANTVRYNPSGMANPGFLFPLGWMINALLVFSLMAYFMDFPRLYLIGLLYAITVPIDIAIKEFAGINLAFIAFGIPAAIIFVMGIIILHRFLYEYPLPSEETPDGS